VKKLEKKIKDVKVDLSKRWARLPELIRSPLRVLQLRFSKLKKDEKPQTT